MLLNRHRDTQYTLPGFNQRATAEWILNDSGLPWLPLSISVPHETIYKEIKNVGSLAVPHREEYAEHQGWRSFCLHGKSYDATREDSHYNDDRPHKWTAEALELMPETVSFFQRRWPGQYYRRVRLMLLEPGGYVSVHRDNSKSGLRAVNIAITQPPDCWFVMDRQGCVPFRPGRAMMLDTYNTHSVINDSDQPRWHIIVHQDFGHLPFQDLVVKSYQDMYNIQYVRHQAS